METQANNASGLIKPNAIVCVFTDNLTSELSVKTQTTAGDNINPILFRNFMPNFELFR